MLKINDLRVSYGVIEAIHGISLEVNEGEFIALIGANGAGKSTLINTISGLLRPVQGNISYQDMFLEKLAPHVIVANGICQVPEGRRIFYDLTVLENLEIGAHLPKNARSFNENQESVYDLFPRLEEREKQIAGTLSGGEQQMLAIGRALMANPKILLLDEPSLGIAPVLVEEIYEAFVRINKQEGVAILAVEQNAFQVLSVASRGYVLETGNIVLEGSAGELLNDESVKKAYLGE